MRARLRLPLRLRRRLRDNPRAHTLVDGLLDRTVVPGYSRLGYAARRCGGRLPRLEPNTLDGAVVAVTGANSGIGAAAVSQLTGLGAEVVMLVRDRVSAAAVRDRIRREQGDARIRIHLCDVSDRAGVLAAARRLREDLPRLDALVHNAGVLPAAREESPQGHEITLATHVLGPVLLTDELLPLLERARHPRVVFVSSGGMYTQGVRDDDPEFRCGPYRGAAAYARTKRMQVALLPLLAEEWQDARVTVAAMHPGWVETPGIAEALPGFHRLAGRVLRTPDQGADTISWLVGTGERLPNARFWHDRTVRPEHYVPWTRFPWTARRNLWRYVRGAIRP